MTSGPQPVQTAVGFELERSLAVIDEATAGAGIDATSRRVARGRAQALSEACGSDQGPVGVVQLAYCAELLSLIAVDLAANPTLAQHLITQLDQLAGVPPVALGREVLSSAHLLELPAAMAIEVRLALLLAFLSASSVALWMPDSGEELSVISHAGSIDTGLVPQRAAAEHLLAGEAVVNDGNGTLGTRIERLNPPPAALVAVGVAAAPGHADLLVAATAPVLAALLDREASHTRADAAEENLLSSVERRLARLRFDLHDGPQQDVHLLAQDLALFREQVRPMIADDINADRLLGRLDDLEAQLVALDGDLRRLSSAVQSPFLAPGSLPDALHQLAEDFAVRTGVAPETTVTGTITGLTDSQQITLLALTREALSNIRKHSNAQSVAITVKSDRDGLHAEIRDDGVGFDPEPMLVQAARAGRLGLVGMHERVRMLGGRTHIDSRPGGPTVISATVPPWPRPEP